MSEGSARLAVFPRGGSNVFKKLLFLFVCLVAFLGTGNAQAASKIQDVVYGVNPNGRLRIVLDTNQPTKYKTEMLDNELRVTVYGNLKSSIPRVTTPKKATYVSKVYLERKVNATVVHVMMKKPLQKGMFNVFSLKEDRVAKRPTRVVVDVIAAPPQKTFTPKQSNRPSSSPWSKPSGPRFGNTYSVVGGIRGKRITLDAGHGPGPTG